MQIELDTHKLITSALTALLIGGGGYMVHKIQQIDDMQTQIAELQKEIKHIKSKTPQIEKNKDNEQDLTIKVNPIIKEFYTDKEQAK